MSIENVEVGDIFYCFSGFPANISFLKGYGKRKIYIDVGDYIEIRYPYKWHFRCEDDVYAQADEEIILKNCRYVGKVKDETKWQNRANLKEILENELYDRFERGLVKRER